MPTKTARAIVALLTAACSLTSVDGSGQGEMRFSVRSRNASDGGVGAPVQRLQPTTGRVVPNCPAFGNLCGAGCCAANTSCGTNGCTVAQYPTSRVCPIGLGLCPSGVCCPPGTICDGSYCYLMGGTVPPCGTGMHQCGNYCCTSTQRCSTQYLGCDTAATASVVGTSCAHAGYCPPGSTCAADGCDYALQAPTTPGVPCPNDGGFCAGGQATCLPDGTCCDGVTCGSECCAGGVYAPGCATSGGVSTCGCPSGHVPCGSNCCAAGDSCVAGACTPTCGGNFPTLCGVDCCAAGIACSAGACQCPADHPVMCGDDCCLPGAACTNGECGCPRGEAECGDLCCNAGEICSNGACTAASSGGSGSCPGGWMGSGATCEPLGSGGSCTCQFLDSQNVCVTAKEFTGATGLPLPATCNPEGSGGCVNTTTGTLFHPCCPGLVCTVGAVCGQSPLAANGTCQRR